MLAEIFHEPFPSFSKEEKIAALLSHRVALFDVVGKCEIQSSSDASIKSVECSDISDILKNSKIQKILLNGQKAYSLFLRFYPDFSALARPMPSTSPANAKVSLEELVSVWGKELK